MAYMVYQRVATAIHDAYGPFGEPSGTGYAARTANLQMQLDMAQQARTWLESLSVEPTLLASIVEPIAVRGTPDEIATRFREFEAAGFTQLEVIMWPPTSAALEAMAPVLEALRPS